MKPQVVQESSFDRKRHIFGAIFGPLCALLVYFLPIAGLANMWIYDFDPAKLHEQFPEMKDYSLYGLLAIGHPDEKEGQPTELHSVRKSLEELVTTF
ncbi:MAG: hypothetical protein IJM41_03150 [Bacteroidales bacterium]|nr:hypothetical protein [Bacteroidales bacterium]